MKLPRLCTKHKNNKQKTTYTCRRGKRRQNNKIKRMVNFKIFQSCIRVATPRRSSSGPLPHICIVCAAAFCILRSSGFPPAFWPFVNEIIFLPPSLPKPKASLSITHISQWWRLSAATSGWGRNGAKGQWRQRRKEACVCLLAVCVCVSLSRAKRMLANRWTVPRSLPISGVGSGERMGALVGALGRQRNSLKHKRDDNNVWCVCFVCSSCFCPLLRLRGSCLPCCLYDLCSSDVIYSSEEIAKIWFAIKDFAKHFNCKRL